MARDLYRATHKAMRKDLFEVSAAIASADFTDAEEAAALRARFAGLVASMEHHSHTEDHELHPLAREVAPMAVDVVAAEHDELDRELAEISNDLAALSDVTLERDLWEQAQTLYLRFNRFVASYLLHIDREERELMPALAMLDGERLDAVARADYAGPVEMLVGAMGSMMPLFNVDDRRQILIDMAAARTDGDYAQIASAAEARLGASEWAKLTR
jgi:hypothetical protein